ncbi:MAG: hypothetical protein Q8Q39_05270 [bacterium]|nr:hypothetical protein [bacterium]
MELAHFRRLNDSEAWFYVKAAFLILGILSAAVAYKTGELAAQELGIMQDHIIQAHARWAKGTGLVFGVLAVAYAIRLLGYMGFEWFIPDFIRKGVFWFVRSFPTPILALCGLAAITVTGALGGSIVYGPDFDPMISLVYRLLGL